MARPRLRDERMQQRLLGVSLDVLESDGVAAFTARRVAAAGDTSTAAVYELFGSKSGLVRAIFFAGFEQLASRLGQVPTSDDAAAELMELFEASRAFAIERPTVFEVMFGRPFVDFEPDESDRRVAEKVYRRIVDPVARMLGQPRNSQAVVDAAHALVALERGLITSELAESLGRSNASIRRRRAVAFGALLAGLSFPEVSS